MERVINLDPDFEEELNFVADDVLSFNYEFPSVSPSCSNLSSNCRLQPPSEFRIYDSIEVEEEKLKTEPSEMPVASFVVNSSVSLEEQHQNGSSLSLHQFKIENDIMDVIGPEGMPSGIDSSDNSAFKVEPREQFQVHGVNGYKPDVKLDNALDLKDDSYSLARVTAVSLAKDAPALEPRQFICRNEIDDDNDYDASTRKRKYYECDRCGNCFVSFYDLFSHKRMAFSCAAAPSIGKKVNGDGHDEEKIKDERQDEEKEKDERQDKEKVKDEKKMEMDNTSSAQSMHDCEKFRTTLSLAYHKIWTHDFQYQCCACKMILPNKNELASHESTVHGYLPQTRRFICKLCHRKYIYEDGLISHMETKHGRESLAGIISGHIAVVHPSFIHECCVCEKKYCNKTVLKRHIKVKHGGIV